MSTMQYPPTELVLDGEGQVYHLGLSPDQISDKIILVGDQDRVDLVAKNFEVIQHRSQHREFVCATGIYEGKRITALSTGIGTDNIDIVMNELDALVNIDLKDRCNKGESQSLDIVRIGTCGILQPEIPVHAYILSEYAFGLDNVAHFYDINFDDREQILNDQIEAHIGLPEKINTYLVGASSELVSKLDGPNVYKGITITSSGFYGPQGRQLRLKTKTTELNNHITSFRSNSDRITNFEMESSALFALGKALGHDCTTICLGIGNRPKKEFSSGYQADMEKLIKYVLDRL